MESRVMKGYYALLGVSPTASASEIRAAYRRLAKQLHPDINTDPGAAALLKAVNEAYAVLSNTKRRAEYDASTFTSPDQAAEPNSSGWRKEEPQAEPAGGDQDAPDSASYSFASDAAPPPAGKPPVYPGMRDALVVLVTIAVGAFLWANMGHKLSDDFAAAASNTKPDWVYAQTIDDVYLRAAPWPNAQTSGRLRGGIGVKIDRNRCLRNSPGEVWCVVDDYVKGWAPSASILLDGGVSLTCLIDNSADGCSDSFAGTIADPSYRPSKIADAQQAAMESVEGGDCSGTREVRQFFPMPNCDPITLPYMNNHQYETKKTWDRFVPSTGRYAERTLQTCSIGPDLNDCPDPKYRLIAKDHDAAGNSAGGSVCWFNSKGWSKCESNGGNHYQLKAASIKWLLDIANGADPGP
jgi:curved DNA-binding protein CbpA